MLDTSTTPMGMTLGTWLCVALLSALLATMVFVYQRLRARHRHLQQQFQASQTTITGLRSTASERAESIHQLQQQLATAQQAHIQQRQQLEQRLGDAQQCIDEATEARLLLAADLAHQTAEWDALRAELDQVTSEASQRERQIDELESLLQLNSEALASLNRANDQEESEHSALRAELTRVEGALDALQEQLLECNLDRASLERKLEQFRRARRASSARS